MTVHRSALLSWAPHSRVAGVGNLHGLVPREVHSIATKVPDATVPSRSGCIEAREKNQLSLM